jgi:hypothetical protein
MTNDILVTPQFMTESAQALRFQQSEFEKSARTIENAMNALRPVWADGLHNIADERFGTLLKPNLNTITPTISAFAELIDGTLKTFEEMDERVKTKIWTEMDVVSAALVAAMPLGQQLKHLGIIENFNRSAYTAPNLSGGAYSNYFSRGQCTWYAMGRFQEKNPGVSLTFNVTSGRDGKTWLNTVSDSFEKTTDLSDIRANSIAVFGGATVNGWSGHVLYIEGVDYDDSGNPVKVYFSEANAGGVDGTLKNRSFADFCKLYGAQLLGFVRSK